MTDSHTADDAGDPTEESMSTPETTVEALLESVQARLETRHELRRLRGENFNVFELLKLEGSEDAHSRFIADLLDPSGSHDQGDSFLRLWLEQLGELAWNSHRTAATEWIEARRAKVERERVIGRVDSKGETPTGGRIDIFISDDEHHLSIENKIWSGEGDRQVTRYCNYRPDRNFVLYLTLHGEPAHTERKNYRPISYAAHIVPWLRSCQQHAAGFPILSGTIKQYAIMVERLLEGLTMDSEIRDAMKQRYMAAWEIQRTFNQLRSEQIDEFVQEVKEGIEARAKRQGWTMGPPPKNHGLVLKCEEKWGEAAVIWEWDWVGIRFRSEPPVSFEDVDKCLHWPRPRKTLTETDKDLYWIQVPKADFANREGIEHLFDESKRALLAEEFTTRLVKAAEYCDETLSRTPN